MGKAGKWLKSFLYGRKDKDKGKGGGQIPAAPDEINGSAATPSPAPKEKKRWSFRRSAAGMGKEATNCAESACIAPMRRSEAVSEQKQHAIASPVATGAEAVVFQLSATSKYRSSTIEESAATKIQAAFRSYLARKALRALKGLVKLQALVRGHLVRKQATAALRCMQALVTVQARARAQRIRMVEDPHTTPRRKSTHRRSSSPQDPQYRRSHEIETNMDEDVKIVEIDLGEWKGNSKSGRDNMKERTDPRCCLYNGRGSKLDYHRQVSPAPSALTDMSPRACSSHLEEFSFNTVDSSPHCYSSISQPYPSRQVGFASRQEDACYPNYMANTESSRAKARSQSAPRQRPDTCERPPSRRKPPIDGGRNSIPRVRMQRSSSQVGSSSQHSGYHYPWSIKLDRSNMSLNDSECGSNSTVLTNSIYCRSVECYEASRHKLSGFRGRFTMPSRASN